MMRSMSRRVRSVEVAYSIVCSGLTATPASPLRMVTVIARVDHANLRGVRREDRPRVRLQRWRSCGRVIARGIGIGSRRDDTLLLPSHTRSEEHTSELQSHSDLVCRLLL